MTTTVTMESSEFRHMIEERTNNHYDGDDLSDDDYEQNTYHNQYDATTKEYHTSNVGNTRTSTRIITKPKSGDIILLQNLQFIPINDFVPIPLFDNIIYQSSSSSSRKVPIPSSDDTSIETVSSSLSSSVTTTTATTQTTTTTIELDGGYYLPGLHTLIQQCKLYDTVHNVPIDAGYGPYRTNLIFTISYNKLQQLLVNSWGKKEITSKSFHIGMTLLLPIHTNTEDSATNDSATNTSTNNTMTSNRNTISVQIIDIIVKENATTSNDDRSYDKVGNNDNNTMIVLDANSPLAGSSYLVSFTVAGIHRMNTNKANHHQQQQQQQDYYYPPQSFKQQRPPVYHIATFALGCFWGAELAYMRTHGVIATCVGYICSNTRRKMSNDTPTTAGKFHNNNNSIHVVPPTYESVCNDTTSPLRYSEAVHILYDPSLISYEELLDVAIERIHVTTNGKLTSYYISRLFRHQKQNDSDDDNDDDDDDTHQYEHAIYFHTKEQHDIATEQLLVLNSSSNHTHSKIKLFNASIATFYKAEEYHQHYLYKGGQSSKKGCIEPIRCYG